MNSSFSQSLELSRMSSTTTLVVWSMIIFLIVLVLGIGVFFVKQLDKRNKKSNQFLLSEKKGKGFWLNTNLFKREASSEIIFVLIKRSRVYPDQRLRLLRRCWSLRLYFSTGVSWWRMRFKSEKIPDFETWRLNLRRADSMPSFSPTVTWVKKKPAKKQIYQREEKKYQPWEHPFRFILLDYRLSDLWTELLHKAFMRSNPAWMFSKTMNQI